MRIFINLPYYNSNSENSRTVEKLKIIAKEKFGEEFNEELIFEYFLNLPVPKSVDRELFITAKMIDKLAECDYFISLNEIDSISITLLNVALQNGIDCCLVSNKEFFEKFKFGVDN